MIIDPPTPTSLLVVWGHGKANLSLSLPLSLSLLSQLQGPSSPAFVLIHYSPHKKKYLNLFKVLLFIMKPKESYRVGTHLSTLIKNS